jgi:prevent-host-death family protein
MRSWPVQDAKARFSELLETCLREGPQIVTKRGTDAAVLVAIAEWQRLERTGKPTLKELLLTDQARGDLNVPPRGARRRRKISDRV